MSIALLLATALAAPIPVVGVTASSVYTETPGYEAEKVADGKQATAWVEGEAGSGLGAWIELDLGAETTVTELRIWGGDWSSYDNWHRANRPKEVEVKFSDDTTQTITFKDEKLAQAFPIAGGKKTSRIRLRLKSSYAGQAWFDLGLSEVQVYGEGASAPSRATAKASSFAPEDGDGNYAPANVLDGLSDSMWCEGDKGDGTGQWLEVDLGTKQAVSKLTLVNGIGSSMALWLKANQALALELTFDDGTKAPVTIERPSFRAAPYTFPAVTTQKVRITVTVVKPGKEFNDLCLSEVAFSG